uniref:Calmodulin-binding domain-containing protein n=1 Tax=Setaria italica TaxID=4555 RepID=K4A6A2_SETIT
MSKSLEKSSSGGTTPTSSASPPESKKHEKTLPNYLRASRGSCHDFCKYGHKNPSEEETSLSGGRRKKLPAHLKNLTLHRSAILDRSKDVRNMSLSLAKSSISLGEAVRVAPRIASANRKGVTSNEHMVPLTATATEHKTLNSDGRKKYSNAAQKVPANQRYSNGVPQLDKRDTVPAKRAIFPAKSKFPEKTSLEKSITVDKVTAVNQSWHKRPASSPSKLNMIKQVPVPSLTKDKNTPKLKEGLDMSGSSLSAEPKIIASVEKQKDDMQIRGYSIESALAELSPDATEYVGNSLPAPEETSKSISEDDGVGSTEKSELVAGEALLESAVALELQQSLAGQEFNAMLGESNLERKLAEQNIVHGQASKGEDNQTDDPAVCRLSEHVTVVENADVYGLVLIESNSKIEDDQAEVNASVESLISECKEQMAVCEGFGTSPELLAVDEKHAEEPESCLDFASGNAVENAKADEVFDASMDNSTSHCQSISETSSDGGLLEEPKSMLIERSDSAVDEVASVSNGSTFEQDGMKSKVFIPQSPEELSNDEFYEEYDFESSESDETGTEDEEATINRDMGESKSGDSRPRRISTVELDDTSITPYKMKFKRGKIVELTPDSSGPRRLKFRRKSANEGSDRESQPTRRIYKRNSTSNAVPTNPDMESPGVKLRHQDAQEKKDAQGLFNNVIEETASKLVESRKSKVKALVGAFETVISLQDGKPTSSTQQAGSSQDLFPDDEVNAPEEAE